MMTPLLEAVLSRVSRVRGTPGFRNDRVSFRDTTPHSAEPALRIPQ
jgi:hypothetical protein